LSFTLFFFFSVIVVGELAGEDRLGTRRGAVVDAKKFLISAVLCGFEDSVLGITTASLVLT
jgi:hypothetical protein